MTATRTSQDRVAISPPAPGRAVIACTDCGRAVDAQQMRWRPRTHTHTGAVRDIVCRGCAS